MTKKQLQKEWFKEWRSKNMGMMILRSISAGLLVISSYFITYIPTVYERDWGFIYQWGTTFYMLVGTILVVSLLLSVVVQMMMNIQWKEYLKKNEHRIIKK
jgi:hypothetical protein